MAHASCRYRWWPPERVIDLDQITQGNCEHCIQVMKAYLFVIKAGRAAFTIPRHPDAVRPRSLS